MEISEIDNFIIKKFDIIDRASVPFKCIGVTRDILAKLMGEIGYKTGAEIGVLRGAYSRTLCDAMPGLKIKCVDPWISFRRNSQTRVERYYNWACRRLRPYKAEIIRKPSMEAVREVPDKSLDFVYIDAMHEFDSVMVDIIFWADKVRAGGMIAGHDYTTPDWCTGVIPAVLSYTQVHNIKKWYITDEEIPSFFWVKT